MFRQFFNNDKDPKKGANITAGFTQISTPYVFFGSDHFDFDPTDANFGRMIREAELQNADVVAAAFKNEYGERFS